MNQKRPVSAARTARAAAARANGAKSRGPITAAGKYNSSLNAIRHAIFAKCLVIPGESQAAFQQLFDEFHDDLRPRTPTERALVLEMVTSRWRKHSRRKQRIWTMEGAHLAKEIDTRDEKKLSHPPDTPAVCASRAMVAIAGRERILHLFLRYETRFERQFHRAHQRLMLCKSRRSDATPDIFETSKRTQEVVENTQPPSWDPPRNPSGFWVNPSANPRAKPSTVPLSH